MHHPAGQNGLRLFIEKIEEKTTHKQACQSQRKEPPVPPAKHHGSMIYGKSQCTEAVCKRTAGQRFQCEKRKAAEEKFLQKGVHKGDINGYKQEVFPVYADIFLQKAGDCGKVPKFTENCISSQNEEKYTHAQTKGWNETFSIDGEELQRVEFRVDSTVQQGAKQEQCGLTDGFDPVYRVQDTVDHQHGGTANDDHAHKGKKLFLPMTQEKHLTVFRN